MKLSRDLTCNELVELVTEYLEGGRGAAERERVEEHIGFCDWCLTYRDPMRRMPPGKRPAWTEAEVKVLRDFVTELDRRQKK